MQIFNEKEMEFKCQFIIYDGKYADQIQDVIFYIINLEDKNNSLYNSEKKLFKIIYIK